MRMDELLQVRFPEHNMKAIQSFILQGKVFVNGRKVIKAGELFPSDAQRE